MRKSLTLIAAALLSAGAAQAADYPTPEAKQTVVMGLQGQIAQTNGALAEVSGNLVRELAKDSSSGGLVNTTA